MSTKVLMGLISVLMTVLATAPQTLAQTRPPTFIRPIGRPTLPIRPLVLPSSSFPTVRRDGVIFEDHTKTSRIASTRGPGSTVGLGEAFEVRSRTLNFNQTQQIEIRLFDEKGRIPGYQVVDILARSGNVLTARTSPLQITGTSNPFRVEVLIRQSGQPNRFMMGRLTVR